MRTAADLPQTRDPLPEGVTEAGFADPCATCRLTNYIIGGQGAPPHTRSVEPAADGRYLIQPHHDWCPIWTGTTPSIGCPSCGAPVDGYDYTRGFWLVLPAAGPNGGPGHIEATEENERRYGWAQRKPAPELDQVTVTPCGDTLQGDDARQVMVQVAQVRADEARREADDLLARHAAMLGTAVERGQGALVAAYREAVHAGSPEAPGLLKAIRLALASLLEVPEAMNGEQS